MCERLQQRLYSSYFCFGKAKERRKPNGFQVSLTQSKRKEGGYKPYEFDSLLLYHFGGLHKILRSLKNVFNMADENSSVLIAVS